jgi:hypothetical protein
LTVGIFDTAYKRNGLTYRVFDAGGSRVGRKRWRYMFENADVVFFQAPLGAYDKCYDDENIVSCFGAVAIQASPS